MMVDASSLTTKCCFENIHSKTIVFASQLNLLRGSINTGYVRNAAPFFKEILHVCRGLSRCHHLLYFFGGTDDVNCPSCIHNRVIKNIPQGLYVMVGVVVKSKFLSL